MGCVDEIVNLAGLDICSEALEQCSEACEPMKMDYDDLREKALDIYLYKGKVHNKLIVELYECHSNENDMD
jgi:hypothetical protein